MYFEYNSYIADTVKVVSEDFSQSGLVFDDKIKDRIVMGAKIQAKTIQKIKSQIEISEPLTEALNKTNKIINLSPIIATKALKYLELSENFPRFEVYLKVTSSFCILELPIFRFSGVSP
jgi:hypothetical protein